jgi:uncharacterized protein DUF2842
LKSRIGEPWRAGWQDRSARHAVAPFIAGCAAARQGLCDAREKGCAMPIRLKKLIGTVLLVALVIIYALVASIVAVAQLSESSPLVHLLFFLLSGLLWVLPAMGIIKWLILEPRPKG